MTTFGTLLPTGEVINKLEVDLNTVPSADPLVFMYGVQSGQNKLIEKNKQGRFMDAIKHGSLHRDLAPEYLRGFLFGYTTILIPEGTKIKKGQEQCYALHNLNTYKRP